MRCNEVLLSLTKLQSIALPLSVTFSQYFQLGNRIRKHYASPRVLVCLLTGQFIPPIHRKSLYSLQYSMLPIRRVGVGELWRLLSSEGQGSAKTSNAYMNGTTVKINGNGRALHGTGRRSKGLS